MRIYSREQRNKQFDWLTTNNNVIATQSRSLFGCSRERKIPSGKRAKAIQNIRSPLYKSTLL
jgi:hypothetical protein